MTAQIEFDRTYITTSEIIQRLGVSKMAVCQAKQKGILPNSIELPNLTIWKRKDIEPYIKDWEKRRK